MDRNSSDPTSAANATPAATAPAAISKMPPKPQVSVHEDEVFVDDPVDEFAVDEFAVDVLFSIFVPPFIQKIATTVVAISTLYASKSHFF
jgi:hypothetical protein